MRDRAYPFMEVKKLRIKTDRADAMVATGLHITHTSARSFRNSIMENPNSSQVDWDRSRCKAVSGKFKFNNALASIQ